MTLTVLSLAMVAALLMRLGVLIRETRLEFKQLLGQLITSAMWGYIAATGAAAFGAAHIPSEHADTVLVAVSAFTGYLGDKRAYSVLSQIAARFGLKLETTSR